MGSAPDRDSKLRLAATRATRLLLTALGVPLPTVRRVPPTPLPELPKPLRRFHCRHGVRDVLGLLVLGGQARREVDLDLVKVPLKVLEGGEERGTVGVGEENPGTAGVEDTLDGGWMGGRRREWAMHGSDRTRDARFHARKESERTRHSHA